MFCKTLRPLVKQMHGWLAGAIASCAAQEYPAARYQWDQPYILCRSERLWEPYLLQLKVGYNIGQDSIRVESLFVKAERNGF